jgi:hypothetical protein
MTNQNTPLIGWANVGSKTHGNMKCSYRDYYNTPFVTTLDAIDPCGRCGGPTVYGSPENIRKAATNYIKYNANYRRGSAVEAANAVEALVDQMTATLAEVE